MVFTHGTMYCVACARARQGREEILRQIAMEFPLLTIPLFRMGCCGPIPERGATFTGAGTTATVAVRSGINRSIFDATDKLRNSSSQFVAGASPTSPWPLRPFAPEYPTEQPTGCRCNIPPNAAAVSSGAVEMSCQPLLQLHFDTQCISTSPSATEAARCEWLQLHTSRHDHESFQDSPLLQTSYLRYNMGITMMYKPGENLAPLDGGDSRPNGMTYSSRAN